MRVWDVDPSVLCDNHLLGEHREIHAIWTILTEDKRGYRNHPEVERWDGKLKALYRRHEAITEEMKTRGFTPESALDARKATGQAEQDAYVDPIEEQKQLLRQKDCDCLRDAG